MMLDEVHRGAAPSLGWRTKQPIKLPKDGELRATKDFYPLTHRFAQTSGQIVGIVKSPSCRMTELQNGTIDR